MCVACEWRSPCSLTLLPRFWLQRRGVGLHDDVMIRGHADADRQQRLRLLDPVTAEFSYHESRQCNRAAAS